MSNERIIRNQKIMACESLLWQMILDFDRTRSWIIFTSY